MKDYVPIAVAIVAAVTALAGYLLNGAAGRRAERMRRYADALDAVERYRQLPYTLRRRHNETAEIRDDLARTIADGRPTRRMSTAHAQAPPPPAQHLLTFGPRSPKNGQERAGRNTAQLKRRLGAVAGHAELSHERGRR